MPDERRVLNIPFRMNVIPPTEKVCDLTYLSDMMGGKRTIILQMIDEFLRQLPDQLSSINQSVAAEQLANIKSYAHSLRSSVSIMGISVLVPVLQEMENLAASGGNTARLVELNDMLNSVCAIALLEMEQQKIHYS